MIFIVHICRMCLFYFVTDQSYAKPDSLHKILNYINFVFILSFWGPFKNILKLVEVGELYQYVIRFINNRSQNILYLSKDRIKNLITPTKFPVMSTKTLQFFF